MIQDKPEFSLKASENYSKPHPLDQLFSPRSIAVVGASNKPGNLATQLLLRPLLTSGFKGSLYVVNNRGKECQGLQIHRKLSDIDGPVDYVIVSIPAAFTPELMKDCTAKGVKLVSLFTSGFSEIVGSVGLELQDNLISIALQGGFRILGPNCMGIFCPRTGLSFGNDFPTENGFVGFLSQSGGNSYFGIRAGQTRNVHFSKVISYGNAVDLNECDFLEYFANDAETEVITAYIEGVKDGKRFFQTLKQTAKIKPVILLKGGSSEAGSGTTISHTGSLAGSDKIWDGLIRQAGAIRVHSQEEILDLAMTFKCMPPLRGLNTGIIGLGGGVSVLAADECCQVGLSIPPLPAKIRQGLTELTQGAGNIFRNPVDSTWLALDPDKYVQATIDIVAGWAKLDVLIFQIAFDISPSPFRGKDLPALQALIDAFSKAVQKCNKPACIVLHSAETQNSRRIASEKQLELTSAGVPVYMSMSAAAKAIVKFTEYHQNKHAT